MEPSARQDSACGSTRARKAGRSTTRLLGVPQVKTYWRSVDQLGDRPEFRDALEREFPAGASELPEGVTRRELIQLLGASVSLAGLAGCRRPVETIVPYVTAPEDVVPGIPRYYATTMPFRRSAYGVIVESHEGRPTKIEGNPAHPSTMGASSTRIQASILGLYDPDRTQSVTLKGAKKSWNDFGSRRKPGFSPSDASQSPSRPIPNALFLAGLALAALVGLGSGSGRRVPGSVAANPAVRAIFASSRACQ